MSAARPYARKRLEVLNSLAARADPDAHPLLVERGHDKVLLVVITADKGLCGAFNANIIRTAARLVEDRKAGGVELGIVGRKGRDAFKRRDVKIRSERVGVFQALRYATARELAGELIAAFTGGEVDEVYLVYNEFKSVLQQRIVVDRLLPIEHHALESQQPRFDYLYEPGPGNRLGRATGVGFFAQ